MQLASTEIYFIFVVYDRHFVDLIMSLFLNHRYVGNSMPNNQIILFIDKQETVGISAIICLRADFFYKS